MRPTRRVGIETSSFRLRKLRPEASVGVTSADNRPTNLCESESSSHSPSISPWCGILPQRGVRWIMSRISNLFGSVARPKATSQNRDGHPAPAQAARPLEEQYLQTLLTNTF